MATLAGLQNKRGLKFGPLIETPELDKLSLVGSRDWIPTLPPSLRGLRESLKSWEQYDSRRKGKISLAEK
jgi:hypothetical protein